MVDFGSGQGLNVFETGGIVGYSEDFKKVKTPPWAKRCRLWMGTNYACCATSVIMDEEPSVRSR
jgi:hypothetical protein